MEDIDIFNANGKVVCGIYHQENPIQTRIGFTGLVSGYHNKKIQFGWLATHVVNASEAHFGPSEVLEVPLDRIDQSTIKVVY